ncbi:hypothetical protein CDAR_23771 [Caerostris darwini]|uniref:Uncharacterized protein n=1 Tax=Caerostris darwini TaxID=1538125 RepID=A0AAV4TX82_9ARAC|nr:hypothetical protein CDAR_23771 [Caerostris darwini]
MLTIGNNRRTPGIIILPFEDDHPTTDLRNWGTKGVEDGCSSLHRMDRMQIPHSNLSHKLPENELAREAADFQELMEMFDVMECLMVLSGVALVIEYSFSLSGQMPSFLYLSILLSGLGVHWTEIELPGH